MTLSFFFFDKVDNYFIDKEQEMAKESIAGLQS